MVVADERRPAAGVVDGVPVIGVGPESILRTLRQLHEEQAFDVLLTQLMYSREALRWAAESNVPSLYFVRNAGMQLDLSIGAEGSPSCVVANSVFTADRAKEKWRRQVPVVYPFVNFEDVLAKDRSHADMITVVNPLVLKGGEVLCALAERNPHRRFLCVYGWTGLRSPGDVGNGNPKWDARQWSLMAAAHGVPHLNPPKLPDLQRCPNIEVVPSTSDMRNIYARTRLLLFPAQWEEAFGRTILEALANGIPVVTSDVGGVKETGISQGGRILSHDAALEVWEGAIKDFDDFEVYTRASTAALKEAATYSLMDQVDRLVNICQELSSVRHPPVLPPLLAPCKAVPVIVLRGGPGVGKSSTARAIAEKLVRSAVIEQDDVRHMVCGGLVACRGGQHPKACPEEYERQCALADDNVLLLASNFARQAIVPVVAGLDGGESASAFCRLSAPDSIQWRPTAEYLAQHLPGLRLHQIVLDAPPSSLERRLHAKGLDDGAVAFVLCQRKAFLGRLPLSLQPFVLNTAEGTSEQSAKAVLRLVGLVH